MALRYQGPQAIGMPELHKLTPPLGVLQDEGFSVALVTDGRMSGASGKVPAAIHVTPECLAGGPLARVRTGDLIRLDVTSGILEARVPNDVLASRSIDAIERQLARITTLARPGGRVTCDGDLRRVLSRGHCAVPAIGTRTRHGRLLFKLGIDRSRALRYIDVRRRIAASPECELRSRLR